MSRVPQGSGTRRPVIRHPTPRAAANGPARVLRGAVADELAPAVALILAAIAFALADADLPAWAVMGALAGYSLSGSV